MNIITIAGTAGKDAEIKHLGDGTPIASFSVADSQGKDKTVWWNCSMFGKRAESVGQYIFKGGKVTVTGQVVEESWTDKNGHERKALKIRVNDIALQSKRESYNDMRNHENNQQQQQTIDEEDLPF